MTVLTRWITVCKLEKPHFDLSVSAATTTAESQNQVKDLNLAQSLLTITELPVLLQQIIEPYSNSQPAFKEVHWKMIKCPPVIIF